MSSVNVKNKNGIKRAKFYWTHTLKTFLTFSWSFYQPYQYKFAKYEIKVWYHYKAIHLNANKQNKQNETLNL